MPGGWAAARVGIEEQTARTAAVAVIQTPDEFFTSDLPVFFCLRSARQGLNGGATESPADRFTPRKCNAVRPFLVW